MQSLVKKLKLKRVVAMLLLVCTVMSTFLTSFNNTGVVYADSTSRRSTSINLAAGTKLTSIDDLSTIDEKSLRTIALYLSNFYIPFVSVLDGEWDEDDSTDSGNKQYETEMLNALTKNCGFDKETAQYLVNYTMAQSLNSCSDLLIKVDDLKSLFKIVSFYDATWEGKVKDWTGVEMSPGFMGWGFADSGETSYLGANGINPAEHKHSGIGYGSADDYINAVGTVSDGTTDYVRISYALFLQLLDVTYAVASIDTFSGDHVDELPDASDFDTYNISNRDKGYSDGVPVINLYYLDGSNKAHIAFSNSEECMQAYALVNAQADYNHGYGSGFASISNSDIDALTQDDYDATKGFVTAPNMCVNWVGDLVLDNGSYRTIVLPGCANPHMLTTMEDSGDNANTIPLQNIFAISNIVDASNNGFTNKELSFYTGSHSLFNLNYWRLQIGSADTTVDDDAGILWWSSHGKGAAFEDAVNNVDYLVTDFESVSNDNFIFPSMFHIDKSKTYTESKSEKAYSQHSTLGYRDEYGHVVYNDNIIYTDSFKATTATDELKKYFPSENLFDIIDSLKAYNTNTYSQFSSVTSQGHAATYNQTTKSLFQSIYLSYCFACFNEEAGGSFSEDNNIINLKTNYGNFPSANEDIDWSSLATSSRDAELKDFVYYLLHPTKGIGYVATLIKNKLAGVLLNWHEDIVGSSDSNSSTGMTKYLGTSSYTTTPSLNDVSWIAKLLEYYNSIIVYLIILICLILLCYVLVGSMTLQRGVIGVLIFGFLAFLPPFAINGTTDFINKTSDTIYSKKFDYWAICQMQTFLDNYDSAMQAQEDGDFTDYAAFVINNQSVISDSVGGTSATSYSGVKLKWMSPKKYSSTASLASALEKNSVTSNTNAQFLLQSVKSAVAVNTSGETFIDNDNALYLYRDYSDIYNYAHTNYNIATTFNYNGALLTSGAFALANNSPTYMRNDSATDTSSVHAVGTHSWNGLSDSRLYNYVLGNDSTNLTAEDVYNESSSSKAISRGFLFNTIDWDFTNNRQSSDTVDKSTYYWSSETVGSRNTLAVTYPMQFNATYREIHDKYKALNEVASGTKAVNMSSGSDLASGYYNFGLTKSTLDKANSDTNPVYGSYLFGYQEIKGLAETSLAQTQVGSTRAFENLSDVYYGLYSESPFYYFNNNIRDQLLSASKNSAIYGSSYTYGYPNNLGSEGASKGENGGKPNNLAKMFLADNQSYFYNLTPNAGDGYGELRDFTNMHDFFYYIIPYLREGVDLSRLYDDAFGLYLDDDCSLSFKDDGSFTYDGKPYQCLADFSTERLSITDSSADGYMTDEEKYKFWHSYNTYTILSAYCSWLDTMMDCSYADSENIKVMGDKFKVANPLDPTTYYTVDASGNLTAGRYMVFSESEMKYYGLSDADLTTVERKIINFQKSVYNETLNLMNYQSVSDEALIQAYAMLQLFEFNKEFSQTSVTGKNSYILYPQGYELKAFSYDAYLRMIMSEASGESLMTDTSDEDGANTSIYKRIMDNTSLFYGFFLLINDVIAVYLIPGLKLFFIVCIFLTSILLILSAAIKLDLNIINVTWKSLLAPLLSFAAVSIGMSFIVSMFMSSGANGITSSALVINTGDPTSVLLLMIVLNAAVLILYFKICKKCFADMKMYFKAVFDSIGSAVTGALGTVVGLATGKARKLRGISEDIASRVSSTAKQRGADNNPKSGKNGLGIGGALAAGAGLGMGAEYLSDKQKEALESERDRANASAGMNKFDKKAYDGANARADKQQAKLDKLNHKAEVADNMGASDAKKERLAKAQAKRKAKLDKAKGKALDIATYGKVGSMKRSAKAGATKALSASSKTVKKAGGRIKSGAIKTYKTATDTQTYANIGAKVTRLQRGAKALPSKSVKAMRSAGQSVAIYGMYAKDAVANAPRNAARAVKGAGETVAIKSMYAIDKGKSGLRKAQSKLNDAKEFGKRAKKAYDNGRTFG
jgi:hypothetical protein